LYSNPADTFVGKFIGNPGINIMPVFINEDSKVQINDKTNNFTFLKDINFAKKFKEYSKKRAILGIRPEYVSFEEVRNENSLIDGELKLIEPLGNETLYHIKVLNTTIISRQYVDNYTNLEIGKKVYLKFNQKKALFFDIDSKKRL
jgi:multiple sugar transport system ATP-binding protein